MEADTKILELLVKMTSAEGYVVDGKAFHFTTEEHELFDTMAAEMAADLAAETSETQHGAEKRTYIVCDYDSMYSTAIKLTADQAKAIGWFIDKMGDVNEYDCYPAEECSAEV
jgi:hypothetical protein